MNSTPSRASPTVSRTRMAVWPRIAGDEGGAIGLDQVTALEIAEAVQDFPHQAGDGGFPGAGIAEEDAVQGRRLRLVSDPGALAFGCQHVDELAHFGLDEARPIMPSSSARARSSERGCG